ncbi:MAG: DUF1330 domain-containing protein [Candidatus Zixiibacteriota bacterium]
MSCYFVAQITIHDPDLYERYLDSFDEVFDRYSGTVVAVDDAPVILEGGWPCTRTVLIRFRDKDEAQRWYRSEEYQKIARYRHGAADANIVLIEGRN